VAASLLVRLDQADSADFGVRNRKYAQKANQNTPKLTKRIAAR